MTVALRVDLAQRLQGLEAVAVGQPDVEEDDIGLAGGVDVERFGAARGGGDLETVVGEDAAEGGENAGFVVDDEGQGTSHRGGVYRASSARKSLCYIRPPWTLPTPHEPPRRQLLADTLRKFQERGAEVNISRLLGKVRPEDVAMLLADLESAERRQVFDILSADFPDAAGDVLTEMAPAQRLELLENLPPERTARLLERIAGR